MYGLLGVLLLAASSERWWVELLRVLLCYPVTIPAGLIVLAFIFRKGIRSLLRRGWRLRRGSSEVEIDPEAVLEVVTTTTAPPTTTTAAPRDDGIPWGDDDRKVSRLLFCALTLSDDQRALLFYLGVNAPILKELIYADVWGQESLGRLKFMRFVEFEGDSVELTEGGHDLIRLLGRSRL